MQNFKWGKSQAADIAMSLRSVRSCLGSCYFPWSGPLTGPDFSAVSLSPMGLAAWPLGSFQHGVPWGNF